MLQVKKKKSTFIPQTFWTVQLFCSANKHLFTAKEIEAASEVALDVFTQTESSQAEVP